MKQNPNIFFFSHAVGTFNLEDEMKGLTEELIGLSLDLEKNKKTGVIKSNIGGYQTDLLKNSNRIIKETQVIFSKAITQFATFFAFTVNIASADVSGLAIGISFSNKPHISLACNAQLRNDKEKAY